MLSCGAVPAIQTLPSRSTMMVCNAVGQTPKISRTSPRLDHIAFLIQLDGLRSPDAAVDPRRVSAAADFIAIGCLRTIQEPDVAGLFFHIKARDLLHAPAIGQGLRPERVHLEHGRALRVHSLSWGLSLERRFLLGLQAAARNRGERQQKTDSKDCGGPSAFFPHIHRTILLLASAVRSVESRAEAKRLLRNTTLPYHICHRSIANSARSF